MISEIPRQLIIIIILKNYMNQKKADYTPFKQKVSFEDRRKESETKKNASPNFIPIILEKHKKSTLPVLPKHKYIYGFY